MQTTIVLPVGTRGVGFSVQRSYDAMIQAHDRLAIERMCTIHQFYRVTLARAASYDLPCAAD